MHVTTGSASRAIATGGMGRALLVSWRAGAVMGLSLASIVLLLISGFYLAFKAAAHDWAVPLVALGFGASLVTLFMRVGGIYTKAASRDAEMRKLRGYTLAVVTDLEDEKLSMEVIERAKGIFREIVFIVVGTARPLQGVKSIRLAPPPPATLFF